ncbi:MAG: hypothetical protein F6J93_21270 [Oscillatoria sp. SIO1A7]|nr:hypothetical protein [Oscillatoria sp. SIO1A7]
MGIGHWALGIGDLYSESQISMMNENVGATASEQPSRLYNGNFRSGMRGPVSPQKPHINLRQPMPNAQSEITLVITTPSSNTGPVRGRCEYL